MRRNYSVVDLIRFAKLSKERADLKPIELIREYDKLYPELTAKEKYENLLNALNPDKELFTCTFEGGKEKCKYKSQDFIACVLLRKCKYAK